LPVATPVQAAPPKQRKAAKKLAVEKNRAAKKAAPVSSLPGAQPRSKKATKKT